MHLSQTFTFTVFSSSTMTAKSVNVYLMLCFQISYLCYFIVDLMPNEPSNELYKLYLKTF